MGNVKKIVFFALLIAFLAYLFLANFYRTYRSEVAVLIIPESQKNAVMHKQIMENAAKIPLTVAFFDKLAINNIDVDNPTEGLSPQKRKDYWNGKLETKVLKDSGILLFIAEDNNQAQAEILARAAASADIMELSRYYNIKEDIRLSIIDGPITLRMGAFWSLPVIIISLVMGIALAIVLYLILQFVQNRKMIPEESSSLKTLPVDTFTIRKDLPAEPAIQDIEENFYPIPEKEPMPEPEIKEPLMPVKDSIPEIAFGKKASAPVNLPTATETIESMFGATKSGAGYKIAEKKSEAEIKPEKPAVYREATPEEVKDRLNRLLGGM